MSRKNIKKHLAMLSMVVILLMMGSTIFTGLASGQQQYAPGGYGDNYESTYQPNPEAGDVTAHPVIQGLEGLPGFRSGHNQLSLAIIPTSQQNNQMTFQVIGFAVSNIESGQAVVYSLKTPLPGIIDPSQYTMQINIANIDSAINTAGYIDDSELYDTMRTDPKVIIIDLDLYYQGKQDSQTIFNVGSVDIVPPDGKMMTYSMQQPTQLIIDTKTARLTMVSFPEMTQTISNYYGVTYPQVEPVVYTEPIPIAPPIYVPYLPPLPIFISGFVGFQPFFFGAHFRPFFDRNRFFDRDLNRFVDRDRFSRLDRFPTHSNRNLFAERSRRDLQTGQRRGDFAQSRNIGRGVKGGIGGYRGGMKASVGGGRMGGGRMGGGRAGGGRRR